MKNSHSIFIIILNYNRWKDTVDLLKSIMKSNLSTINMVVVDNRSTDDSIDQITRYFNSLDIKFSKIKYKDGDFSNPEFAGSGITIICTDKNGGYGYGNNIGIKYAMKNNCDYILILNNDTIVNDGFLEPLIEKCENDKTIGLASGRIFYYDQPDILWSNGGKFSPVTGRIKIYNFNECEPVEEKPERIEFLSGCVWFIPARIVEKIGLIDEDFFMYFEDLEYCNRVISNGFKLTIESRSKILHKIPLKQKEKDSVFSVYWRSRNIIVFYKQIKNPFYKKIVGIFSFNFLMLIKLIKFGNAGKISAMVKGIISGMRFKVK